MKRPEKKALLPKTMDEQIEFGYRESDIDLILDKLEALRGAEEFPKFNDFVEWATQQKTHPHYPEVYNYFAQFKTRTIEVMPDVWREYEFSDDGENWHKDILAGFDTDAEIYIYIRPIQTPNRDEVIAKAKELGLTEAEIAILG